ncbi:hypothetical protein FRE64_12800 [Euhalothece natronophila Z-M001]|uniref:Tetratricopeptide repeat protein n=1 Tax=Euhalothece natronophila Z-M001 TaxID=522448 RepID=A0A5B8NP60_9CHRO|nr:hypothetical protein [Euhalothece natronophila]QDZ40747.1 hypothetical protein FRE64_12800 [Euhalothece natronophila Z-M001]
MVANWAYLRSLQYFGDKPARRETGYSLLPKYLEVIAKQDPQFIQAYRFIAPVSSIYAGRPQETIHWLERALEEMSPEAPLAYVVWVHKAHDELLFLGDAQAASKSYKMAAEWASKNPDTERNANSLRRTAEFIEENPTSPIPKIGSWGMVLRHTPDQEVQEIAIENIQELGGDVIVDEQGRVQIEFPEED